MKGIFQKKWHQKLLILMLTLCSLMFVTVAKADPPTRVARLSYLNGSVSFSPAGQDQWVYATYNRPLTTNDRLWVDANSRAELQLGAATLRLADNTALTVVNLDDNNAQFSLSQGTLNFHLWAISSGQVYEVDTPNLSFIIREPGDYRIDVQQNTTTISVRSGQGEVYGQGASYLIQAPQACQFTGGDISNYQCSGLASPDSFDQWCLARNVQAQNSVSARYVSRDVIGYQDLDNYGSWQNISGYGYAWSPNNVPAGWAPYRDGQWTWIAPWGWTWVDNSPWGFAPYHYGRWTNFRGQWYWIPGARHRRPIYAPALVVFIGNFQLSVFSGGNNNIGWFPLGPGEAYFPSYHVSRNYFTYVNVNNTVINNTYITNIYNKPPKNFNYRNKTVVDAVSVVPMQDFFKSKKVKDVLLKVPSEDILKAKVVPLAATSPADASKTGGASPSSTPPPEEAFTKPVPKFKPGKGQSFPKPVTIEPKPITPSTKPEQPVTPSSQPKPLEPVTPSQPPAEKIHPPKHKEWPPVTTQPQPLGPPSGAPTPPPGAFQPSTPSSVAPAQPSGLASAAPPVEKTHPTKPKEWPQTLPSQPAVNPPTFTPPQPPASIKPPKPTPTFTPPASVAPSAPAQPVRPAPALPVAPAPAPVMPAAPPPPQMNFQAPKEQHMKIPAPAAQPAPAISAPAATEPAKKHKDKDDKDKDNSSN